MTSLVHGCASPRGHSAQQHHLPHQSSTPLYPSVAKYSRSSSQPTATPSHHHQMYSSQSGTGTGSGGVSMNKKPATAATFLPAATAVSQYNPSPTTQQLQQQQQPRPGSAYLSYRSGRHSNRKTAVELLAESKQFYVKSDSVMERMQQSSAYRQSIACGNKRGRHSLDSGSSERYVGGGGAYALQSEMERSLAAVGSGINGSSRATHLHHHHHAHGTSAGGGAGGGGGGRRSAAVSANNLLQSKLRKLLSAEAVGGKDMCGSSRLKERYREELTSSSGGNMEHSTPVFPSMLLAQSFLSPQSLPLQTDAYADVYNFRTDNSNIAEGPLVLTDDYRPISPPAEYAAEACQPSHEQRARYNYQRSYSHSHEMAAADAQHTANSGSNAAAAAAAAYNINSHKSLPDLHSQISRHSPHSEILSCCSRGNRSIKSTGESSLNRDSGGSSGHYTHRSEPCYKQQRDCEREAYENTMICTSICSDYRRDSGSSTQHSANSYYRSGADCGECHCKNSSAVVSMEPSDYLLNFTTPEVPEAFQDDYSPPSPSMSKYLQETQRYVNTAPLTYQQQQQQQTSRKHAAMLQSPGSAPSVEDLSPPPIQFKRQKCIRFKNRQRVTLSNVGAAGPPPDNSSADMFQQQHQHHHQQQQQQQHRSNERPTFFFPKTVTPPDTLHYKPASGSRRNSHQSLLERDIAEGGINDLEKFFDRLGLNDDKYHEIYSPPKRRHSAETDSDESSTVFFSDVSTVDSMRLPDSTETQPQTTATYRPTAPPSIVERNARIIKWLCNCRKLQYTQ